MVLSMCCCSVCCNCLSLVAGFLQLSSEVVHSWPQRFPVLLEVSTQLRRMVETKCLVFTSLLGLSLIQDYKLLLRLLDFTAVLCLMHALCVLRGLFQLTQPLTLP